MKKRALRLLAPLALLGAAPPYDLLVRGGTIYTGDAAPFVGDVAVRGDRIVAVGRTLGAAVRTIDARGMIVAPGFIDPHTHIEAALASPSAATRLVPAFLLQGVTTAFIGNDGYGTPDVAQVLGTAGVRPPGINYAAYVGFGAVRGRVIGAGDRPPTPAQLARMKTLVARAMCDGALGLSTGLFYAPQSYATAAEVTALAREAGARGGVYDSHIRDESSYGIGLAAAIDEAIAIGRDGGLAVHIAHIKALGVDVQGHAPAIIARIEAARSAGQRVTADQYPWDASGTSLVAALVPRWAQAGGRAAMLARLGETRLHTEMAEALRKRGGAGKIAILEGAGAGRTLAEVAAAHRQTPVEAAIGLIRVADASVLSFNQSESDIAAFMARAWVMTGSDASGGHPRRAGSFARKYAVYVRGRGVLSVRDFIARSSALPADTFGLKDRGRLRVGAFADIVVFDPMRYAARATYQQPNLTATGARTVIVNGRVAIDGGRLTGVAAGRALAHVPPPGSCP